MSRNPRKDPSHPGHNSTGGSPPGLRMMLENGRANGRRWRVSAGFLVQAALLALVVSLPLFHTEPLGAQAPGHEPPVYLAPPPRGTPGGTGHGPGGPAQPAPTRPPLPDLSKTPIFPIHGTPVGDAGPAPDVGSGDGSGPPGPGIPDGSDRGVPGGKGPVGPQPPVVVVGGQVQPPRLIERVEPTYPPLARQAGVEGEVLLEAVIGTDGQVQQVTVVSGQVLFVKAAQSAVEQWRYEPTHLNGRPVAVLLRVTVQFRLRR